MKIALVNLKLHKNIGEIMKRLFLLVGMLAIPSFAAVSANVSFASDYVWRGMTQSDGPAIQGGFDFEAESGFYAGIWGSNVNFNDGAGSELDYYAGFAGEAGALSYDIGYLAFTYPGEDSLDFEEIYLGLGFSYFGVTYSSGQDSAPDNVEFSVSLGDTGLGLTYGDYDEYGEYTIVSYDLPISIAGLGVSLSWNDFSSEDGMSDDDTVVVTFSM